MNAESNQPSQPGTMSNSLIRTLIDNYRQNHLKAINTTLEIEDAHSIWFDLPKLKRFIATIEKEAAKVKPALSEGDLGIRFYYASYPNEENWSVMEPHTVPVEYAKKHTLIMIPTLKKANEAGELLDFDFNPLQETEEKSSSALNARISKDIGDGDKVLGENNGQLIPPLNPNVESF